jgi:uncharacterized membrane protein HdeD (DUF308 family)
LSPAIRLETVVLLTIIHALVNGIGEGGIAATLRHHKKEAAILGVMALLSVSTAVILLVSRNGPISSMTTVLGSYAFVYGVCLTYFGWHLHHEFKKIEQRV